MRIWDLPTNILCRQHLLGEHRELHAIWTYLTTDKGGSYRNHPETLRWEGNLAALFLRHKSQVKEMTERGYNHNSPIIPPKGIGLFQHVEQKKFVNTIEEQLANIRSKGCECKI